MMTQREKLTILVAKLEAHNFFDGPYMISRAEGAAILKAMEYHLKNLNYNHERYMARQDELNQRSKDRYRQKKMEVFNDVRT